MHILHATNKVGLLPYRLSFPSFPRKRESSGIDAVDSRSRGNDDKRDDGSGTIEFLLHLPRPKNPADAHLMKWGVARGTVRWRDAAGVLNDIRDAAALPSLPPESIEPHADAALHEAEEELGLLPADMRMDTWRDHGLLGYVSETRGRYDLHLFSVAVCDGVALEALKARARDALDVGWFSLAQMRQMVAQEHMKAGYVSMVEAVEDALGKAEA